MLKNFTKENFDIIIQAGQSNSEGYGFGDATQPYIVNENVWYLNGDFTIYLASEAVSGNLIQSNYALSFANQYIEKGLLKGGRKLLILRTSVGGTGFADNRWGLKDDLYLRMMDMIKTSLELGGDNKLVAFLWHQGETDALANASYETHYKNLFSLISSVKESFDCNKLPFIAGDFVSHWKNDNIAACEPIIKAMIDVCENTENGKFVYTDELLSNQQTYKCIDPIHFSRESLRILGEKYFNAYELSL